MSNIGYQEMAIDKFQKQYEEYKKSLTMLSVEEVIKRSYETVYKQELICSLNYGFILSDIDGDFEIEPKTYWKCLYEEYDLDDLYNAWLSYDGNDGIECLCYAIEEEVCCHLRNENK